VIGCEKRPGASVERGDIRTIAMPLHLQWVDWMPSPPLVPDDGPIDLDHLKRMTLGDESLEREVLAMFSAQSVRLIGTLRALPAEARALAHTLQGSARAVGAFAVADAAAVLETALTNGDDPTEALAELGEAVAQARTAIDALLRRS
jgi:HPt (histidine-containing phosphotransfer) domain-containing protein